MLDVINLDFDYQSEPLLKKVTFRLPVGGLLHLRGANGAGKTTLLKVVAGLYPPLQGEIKFFGHNIAKNQELYQRQICFVGHKTGINPNLTLRENCFFDLHYSSIQVCRIAGEKMENIEELASHFKLEHYLDFPCGLLSAGQRRQVGLFRLWMSNTKLWLLDEPLVALDEKSVYLIMNKIEAHRLQGGAVLLTSHQQLPINGSNYEEYFL